VQKLRHAIASDQAIVNSAPDSGAREVSLWFAAAFRRVCAGVAAARFLLRIDDKKSLSEPHHFHRPKSRRAGAPLALTRDAKRSKDRPVLGSAGAGPSGRAMVASASSEPGVETRISPNGNARSVRQWIRLVLQGLALVLVPLLVGKLIVVFVPDGNDYALVTHQKHARLAADVPKKLVFVGGSNLSYGLDSSMVAGATGRHITNMGMNGYLGVRYMLEEIKPYVRSPDVVVLSFEYDSFYKSIEGRSSDLLMVVKARPKNLSYLTWSQRLGLVRAVPYVAQRKTVRLIRESGRSLRDNVRGEQSPDPLRDILAIETLAGFEEHGDLVSHFDTTWAYDRLDGYDLSNLKVDPVIIGHLEAFTSKMQARGVQVLISYTPTTAGFYARHRKSIDDLHERLTAAGSLRVLGAPEEFVFPEQMFFDTVYHLNEDGRAERTRLLIRKIMPYLQQASVDCAAAFASSDDARCELDEPSAIAG
jgi:hypothetical protein